MPKRKDIKSIFILGSGPIIIGQACEFDYSGTQACRVLRKDGFRIILLNSNPATIMTDPDMADATYIEPITLEIAEKIIAYEKPDAILPTVGGQTALNLSMELHQAGVLKKYNVELLGASMESIHRAESRREFKIAIESLGLRVPESAFCTNLSEARSFYEKKGLPLIIRPSFTLGGTGSGIARTKAEFENITWNALNISPVKEILVEESVIGWKEFELELMRDTADNVVVICSIENLDPMGVHTGDSITVAPQQTLSDSQYQKMRNAAIDIIRKVGIATGGSNIQFAINPRNGDMIVIEMNPRVSRSSSLASKATGFPIAKIAAQLAVGYTLDELINEITKVTPCCFEPALDYVVTKAPRFAFEKFSQSEDTLGAMMHSVGESMGIGRNFKESLQKALRSLEISRYGLGSDGNIDELFYEYTQLENSKDVFQAKLEDDLKRPNPQRIFSIKKAIEWGQKEKSNYFSLEKVHELTKIDFWFLYQILDLVVIENKYKKELKTTNNNIASIESITELKKYGYSDRQLAYLSLEDELKTIILTKDWSRDFKQRKIISLLKNNEAVIRNYRIKNKLIPVYKRVDTCAGEFQSHTPYLYSSYESENEADIKKEKKVMIIGSGTNRIGQGIEFDYCCCHASFALQEMGIKSIMINSNPETVSTDYDISNKLYFEPISLEDILHIYHLEKPDGIIISFGGQTPLAISNDLINNGCKILGTSPSSIDATENRDSFSKMIKKLKLRQAPFGLAHNVQEAREIIKRIPLPVLIRPSYVLGGRAMVIAYTQLEVEKFIKEAIKISPEYPALIDSFLENATELDVDAISDGDDVFVAGIMQHIEEAGIHSGDSACILPAIDIAPKMINEIESATKMIAIELNIRGPLNIQFAIYKNELYVIEVNPRASRTVPFVSKAIGLSLAKLATKVICGQKIKDLHLEKIKKTLNTNKKQNIAVKEAVFPFARFHGSDILLGPEMKSTGEVMGIAPSIGQAFIKAQLSTGELLPQSGSIFFSVSDYAKETLYNEVAILLKLGFIIYSTHGTKKFLEQKGIIVKALYKLKDKLSPNPFELIQSGEIKAIINIPNPQNTHKTKDSSLIRQEASNKRILCVTTVAATKALVHGLEEIKNKPLSIASLQSMHTS